MLVDTMDITAIIFQCRDKQGYQLMSGQPEMHYLKPELVNYAFRALEEGIISFKGGHDKHTSFRIIDGIVSKIRLGSNILVLFNIEFVIALVYKYNVDVSNITFYSDHKDKTVFCQEMGVTKIIEAINETYEGHIVKIKEIKKKFNVILTNPPYQDQNNHPIYQKFLKVLFELTTDDAVIAAVTPDSWIIGDTYASLKKSVFPHMVTMRMLTSADWTTDIAISTMYFIADKTISEVDAEIITPDGKSTFMALTSSSNVAPADSKENLDLLRPYFESPSNFIHSFSEGTILNEDHESLKKHSSGTYIYISGLSKKGGNNYKSNSIPSNAVSEYKSKSNWLVVFGYERNEVITIIDNRENNVILRPTRLRAIGCSSKKEAEWLRNYLDSAFVRFLILNFRKTKSLSNNVLQFIPSIDHKINTADDDAIFNFFKIPQILRSSIFGSTRKSPY
jgi:hypothetical protein